MKKGEIQRKRRKVLSENIPTCGAYVLSYGIWCIAADCSFEAVEIVAMITMLFLWCVIVIKSLFCLIDIIGDE